MSCPHITRGDISEYADVGLQNLAALKSQLKETLAEIERDERELEAHVRPQTLEDVEKLEQELRGALEELQARRSELEGGG